jgi:prepilin-type N-terminal cleavage/methylation domain-containing protein
MTHTSRLANESAETMKTPQSRRAFTLIELLVVIAIIASLAAICLWRIPNSSAKSPF